MSDRIRLMTEKEFHKYEEKIPPMECAWYLEVDRENGIESVITGNSAGLNNFLCSTTYCDKALGERRAVRPVIEASAIPFINIDTQRAFYMGATWIRLSDDLFISEMPIGFSMYNDIRCNYEDSAIRKFILDWYEDRKFKDEAF